MDRSTNIGDIGTGCATNSDRRATDKPSASNGQVVTAGKELGLDDGADRCHSRIFCKYDGEQPIVNGRLIEETLQLQNEDCGVLTGKMSVSHDHAIYLLRVLAFRVNNIIHVEIRKFTHI